MLGARSLNVRADASRKNACEKFKSVAGDVRVETNAFRETGCFDFSRDVNVS